ncbi:SDR family NAD(P)-dependent oxidoreductase [Lichenibacterium dinghuense]|uniref:SDR family NAD(P)-dependent oxidoreductase n=1 Tax=Lichenibacterium dinghuense TaxID=2895977 RepID=UPI0028166963|nr:SDR family NAD(P)-dependent oxidoreductase [Lichenibacterium sp. 6Y81]
MARRIENTTVVVAGASSGIGRATALLFAEQGTNVVVAARRVALVDALARECEAAGGRALAVPTDVTDAAAVRRLAEAAVARFGTVDTWVNVAGTGVFGPFEEAEAELHAKTVEVNLIGAMNGAAAALPIFKRRGSGVLISTVSMGGWSPVPFAAAYTASKFGLRGFNASLRQQFDAREDIHVCGVFPAMVDTPGLEHVANASGRHIDPGPFLYTAGDVASAILGLARHPRGEVAVGWPARAGQAAYALSPRLTELLTGAAFRWLLRRAGPAPKTEGALRAPIAAGTTASGGALARKGLPSAGPISLGLAVGGVLALAGAVLAAERRR